MNSTLIVGPAWVGDMMMAQTLFALLKQQNDVAIDVLAPAWSVALLARMPQVRQSITSPFVHGELRLRDRYQLAKTLRKNKYQHAYVLPNSWKSAFIPFCAKVPKRVGWVGEQRYGLLNDIRKLDAKAYPKMVQRFAALALPKGAVLPDKLPQPRLQIDPAIRALAIRRLNLTITDAPILALCPGAEYGYSKQWPAAYYAALANYYSSLGWQVWLFGSKNDRSFASAIEHKSNHGCVNLTGRTDLSEAIDLMSLVATVVTNDSGLMHIAAALDKPLVAVYGSTSAEFTPPLSDKAVILTASEKLPCQPCFKRTCPLQHHNCMKQLRPEQVIAALEHQIQAQVATVT